MEGDAERVIVGFGLDGACCPWGGAWTWQSARAKCSLMGWEKLIYSFSPGEMAQGKAHGMSTSWVLQKCQLEQTPSRGKEGEGGHCRDVFAEGNPSQTCVWSQSSETAPGTSRAQWHCREMWSCGVQRAPPSLGPPGLCRDPHLLMLNISPLPPACKWRKGGCSDVVEVSATSKHSTIHCPNVPAHVVPSSAQNHSGHPSL